MSMEHGCNLLSTMCRRPNFTWKVVGSEVLIPNWQPDSKTMERFCCSCCQFSNWLLQQLIPVLISWRLDIRTMDHNWWVAYEKIARSFLLAFLFVLQDQTKPVTLLELSCPGEFLMGISDTAKRSDGLSVGRFSRWLLSLARTSVISIKASQQHVKSRECK